MADRRPRFRPHLPLVLAVLAALVPPGPPPAAHAATFANTTSLAITAGAPGVTDGPASLYPSPMRVSGLSGNVVKVTVTLHGLSHTSPSDLDVLLVGPGGQTVDGTARAGTDFVAVRGTLTFAPGVVRRTILVPVVGDRAAEPLEQMRVVLSGASVGLADPVGIGTILNDD